jgi:hypothetical protein
MSNTKSEKSIVDNIFQTYSKEMNQQQVNSSYVDDWFSRGALKDKNDYDDDLYKQRDADGNISSDSDSGNEDNIPKEETDPNKRSIVDNLFQRTSKMINDAKDTKEASKISSSYVDDWFSRGELKDKNDYDDDLYKQRDADSKIQDNIPKVETDPKKRSFVDNTFGRFTNIGSDLNDIDDTDKEAGLGAAFKILTDHTLSPKSSSNILIKGHFGQVTNNADLNTGWSLVGSKLYSELISNNSSDSINNMLETLGIECCSSSSSSSSSSQSQQETDEFRAPIKEALIHYKQAIQQKKQDEAYHIAYELANLLHETYSEKPEAFNAHIASKMSDSEINSYSSPETIGAFRRRIKRTAKSGWRKIRNAKRRLQGKAKVAPSTSSFNRIGLLRDRLYLADGATQAIFADDFILLKQWEGAQKQLDNPENWTDSIQYLSRSDFNIVFTPRGSRPGSNDTYVISDEGGAQGMDGALANQAFPRLYFGKRRGSAMKRSGPLGTQYSWTFSAKDSQTKFETEYGKEVKLEVYANFYSTAYDAVTQQRAWKRSFSGYLTLKGGKPSKLSSKSSRALQRRRTRRQQRLDRNGDDQFGGVSVDSTNSIRRLVESGELVFYSLLDNDSNSFMFLGFYQADTIII